VGKGHKLMTPAECNCGCPYCGVCEGTLAYCTICKGGEMELDRDCPGPPVQDEDPDHDAPGPNDNW